MRVLIINTAERIGGAAIAASRLMDALRNNGIKAKMLVRNKQTGTRHCRFAQEIMVENLAVPLGTPRDPDSQPLQQTQSLCR